MAMNTRRLYRSANGDRWDLARDTATGRVFIRHEANEPSGGQVTDIEIGDFLTSGGGMALSTPSCCVSSERWWGSAPMPKGPKGEKRAADVIGNAVRVMEIATG
jgi:hypothetical protein